MHELVYLMDFQHIVMTSLLTVVDICPSVVDREMVLLLGATISQLRFVVTLQNVRVLARAALAGVMISQKQTASTLHHVQVLAIAFPNGAIASLSVSATPIQYAREQGAKQYHHGHKTLYAIASQLLLCPLLGRLLDAMVVVVQLE